MSLSIFLAKLLGLYYIIMGVAILCNIKFYTKAVKDLKRHTPLMFFSGPLILIVGLALVLVHNVWVGWPILITLTGWLIVLKAITFLFFPHIVGNIAEKVLKSKWYPFAVSAIFVFGGMFCYIGFFLN